MQNDMNTQILHHGIIGNSCENYVYTVVLDLEFWDLISVLSNKKKVSRQNYWTLPLAVTSLKIASHILALKKHRLVCSSAG